MLFSDSHSRELCKMWYYLKGEIFYENANGFARSGAVENIATHCSKETFDSLAPVIDGLTDKDAKDIQDKYKSQAEKLNQ